RPRVPGPERRTDRHARRDLRTRLEPGLRSVLEPDRGLHQPPAPPHRESVRSEIDPDRSRRGLHPRRANNGWRRMFYSVRARLTLWYTVVLAVVLVTFSGISYVLLSREIRASTD